MLISAKTLYAHQLSEQVLITDGALIRIVFRKDLPELSQPLLALSNIGLLLYLDLSYQFNDLSSTTTDSQTTIDMTLEYEENDSELSDHTHIPHPLITLVNLRKSAVLKLYCGKFYRHWCT